MSLLEEASPNDSCLTICSESLFIKYALFPYRVPLLLNKKKAILEMFPITGKVCLLHVSVGLGYN